MVGRFPELRRRRPDWHTAGSRKPSTAQNLSGTHTISGPLLVLFTGLPTGVTLQNATSDLSGMPYVTLSAGLAPGQSIVVSVKFLNPANATINLTTSVYSGTIN